MYRLWLLIVVAMVALGEEQVLPHFPTVVQPSGSWYVDLVLGLRAHSPNDLPSGTGRMGLGHPSFSI